MFEYFIKNLNKDNRGFTLIELVVVISILGILAAIAIPKMIESRKNAAIAAHNANVRSLFSVANIYISEGGKSTVWYGSTDLGDTDNPWYNYLENWPEVPNGLAGKTIGGISFSNNPIYKVEIGKDGSISITPGTIVED